MHECIQFIHKADINIFKINFHEELKMKNKLHSLLKFYSPLRLLAPLRLRLLAPLRLRLLAEPLLDRLEVLDRLRDLDRPDDLEPNILHYE